MLKRETTLIYNESLESAAMVERQLQRNLNVINKLASRFSGNLPRLLVTSARGSSYHATTYARSLFELELGIASKALTLSVSTVYNKDIDLNEALFLTISQSGESPDLIMQAKAAKAAGAYVLAIVNNTNSTLSSVADAVLPICAGPELSVAATKSFIGSLSNIALLVSGLKKDQAFNSSVRDLPQALGLASQIDWSDGYELFANAQRGFILGRGPNLSIACEAALKMKETCGIQAEAFSTAEVQHGPMTLIKGDFPVLIFNPKDEAYASNVQLIQKLAARNSKMRIVGQGALEGGGLLPPKSLHPRLDPILMIQAFYPYVSSLSLLRGFDPDKPEYLSKVTQTI